MVVAHTCEKVSTVFNGYLRKMIKQEGKKEEKRRLQLIVSSNFYDWLKEEASKRGLEDRMGRFIEILVKELLESKK